VYYSINIIEMMHIKNDPIVFTWDDIDKYLNENIRCNYLLETEYQGVQYAVFYHPLPLREYRGAYWTEDQYKWKDVPAVVEAGWIEEIEIDGVIADNQDVIFSRYPTERRTSDDGSVWIRGSETNVTDSSRLCRLTIFKGRLEFWENEKY
jgi:hypothetical protein